MLTSNPVFQRHCAKCHGKTAEGRHFGGPSLLSRKAAAMSDEELSTMIKDGKGRMPKYGGKLTADEIDSLVQQIKTASHK
jgi:mono/diheme cytochrome c family protein